MAGALAALIVFGMGFCGAQDLVSQDDADARVAADFQVIETQLKVYQAMNGFLPTTKQGLQALITMPEGDPSPAQWRQLFQKMPLDPWKQPYQYECPGKHNPNSFDLYSMGPDRKAETDDDIGNWEAATPAK